MLREAITQNSDGFPKLYLTVMKSLIIVLTVSLMDPSLVSAVQ